MRYSNHSHSQIIFSAKIFVKSCWLTSFLNWLLEDVHNSGKSLPVWHCVGCECTGNGAPARNGDGAGGPQHTNGRITEPEAGAGCPVYTLAWYTLISTSLREIGAEYNYLIIMSSTTWHQFVIKVVIGIF